MFRAEYYLPADGAAPHTRQPVFTAGTALAKVIPEILENWAVPRLLDAVGSQVHRPPPALVVKAARKHHHIRGDISRPAGTLAGIDAGQVDIH